MLNNPSKYFARIHRLVRSCLPKSKRPKVMNEMRGPSLVALQGEEGFEESTQRRGVMNQKVFCRGSPVPPEKIWLRHVIVTATGLSVGIHKCFSRVAQNGWTFDRLVIFKRPLNPTFLELDWQPCWLMTWFKTLDAQPANPSARLEPFCLEIWLRKDGHAALPTSSN